MYRWSAVDQNPLTVQSESYKCTIFLDIISKSVYISVLIEVQKYNFSKKKKLPLEVVNHKNNIA